jgi:hypothetical protein
MKPGLQNPNGGHYGQGVDEQSLRQRYTGPREIERSEALADGGIDFRLESIAAADKADQ